MATDTPAHPVPAAPAGDFLGVHDTGEFRRLRSALRNFVLPMTVAFLAWYGLYVLLSAYARGFMKTQVIGNINVALIFGLLQFLTTFLIAWLYAWYAVKRVDPLARELRARIEGGTR